MIDLIILNANMAIFHYKKGSSNMDGDNELVVIIIPVPVTKLPIRLMCLISVCVWFPGWLRHFHESTSRGWHTALTPLSQKFFDQSNVTWTILSVHCPPAYVQVFHFSVQVKEAVPMWMACDLPRVNFTWTSCCLLPLHAISCSTSAPHAESDCHTSHVNIIACV